MNVGLHIWILNILYKVAKLGEMTKNIMLNYSGIYYSYKIA